MASFSVSSKVEPDADDDCVEEEVLHFSYLFLSILMISLLLLHGKGLFQAVCRIWMADGPKRLLVRDSAYGGNKTSRAIKGAPLESLFAQCCLHSLWFGDCNIRAIAVLWIEFVREVRWCWEESQLIPRMPANGSIDLSTCLINQKLQMYLHLVESEDADLFNDKKHSDGTRRGSAGIVDSMMLLKSHESMHAPYTQEAPLMTEDMHEECLQAVEDFSDSLNFSAQVERDTLALDMSAFKAANPDAVFEDFIRDWIEDDLEFQMSKDNWPPRGRLSKRISENGNAWRNFWSSNPALPVSEQKPLLEPNREGEKVLHFVTENRLSADIETIEDLRRLCVVFQHVEKLLTLAASLRRKFLQAPRLAREIFSDFYSFYIPRMGIGPMEEKEFDKKQAVWNEEREVVSNMLVPPSANQSWGKVLSMGNLLNGHEPILREIIFSLHGVNGNHYATSTASVSEQKIETYRMLYVERLMTSGLHFLLSHVINFMVFASYIYIFVRNQYHNIVICFFTKFPILFFLIWRSKRCCSSTKL